MNVLGVGVDIIETQRVAESLQRFGDRFCQRCFLPGEIAYCRRMKFPARHFAARFAAKEAVAKAFGTGIGAALGWKDIEIRRHDSGQPYVVLHGNGARLARQRGAATVLVSLSHGRDHAVAQAVLVAAADP